MPDAPNTSPGFMQTMGILGFSVELTNQICTPDNPQNIPLIAYDSNSEYVEGNGALGEMVDIQLTGNTPATCVLMFIKLLEETTPKWRKSGMKQIVAATYSPTQELPSYTMPLKDILFPIPHTGNSQSFKGLRINSSGFQLGFALTVATTFPIIVTVWGGEY